VLFGPDIAQRFMDLNGIDMIVRSHECVYDGFDLPYQLSNDRIEQFYKYSAQSNSIRMMLPPPPQIDKPNLCTLFSASNYCGGDNQAAILTFYQKEPTTKLPNHHTPLQPVGGKSQLQYSIYYYKTSDAAPGDDDDHDDDNSMVMVIMIIIINGVDHDNDDDYYDDVHDDDDGNDDDSDDDDDDNEVLISM